MQINKKILFLILGLSLHGAIKSMDTYCLNIDEAALAKLEEQEKIRVLVGIKSRMHILNFARPPKHNPEHLRNLAKWLTEQRNTITETHEWNLLVKQLSSPIICGCYCEPNERTKKVHGVVAKIASELQPDQDCSEQLIAESNKAIEDYNACVFYSYPLLGNGFGADWNPASSKCYCNSLKK